ncbi:HD family hydrolase [Kosakonia phage Kc263]|uniref:HD family hydrolase n=1 Tax=Kosakonia phage Kc263 TaxID=2863194 RepID=A0AAE7WFT9_9CAUD|nr:HD family hydrolase [Kosakonia phage Kc263]QYN80085.1 HD family hydrolase [Kosakonia phage Kc263]
MDNVVTLDEAKVQQDADWAKLFNYRVQKELLRYCVYSISLNDPAHNLGHVMDVCRLGKRICEEIGLDERTTLLVYLGCLLHDIGCKFERKHHHLIGYGLTYELIDRYWPGEFDDEEMITIATAVLEHRSSNKHKPSSLVSSIVSVADSGAPDLDLYIKRAIQFRLKNNLPGDQLIEDVYKHLLEKFGVEGYHWKSYPDVGMEMFQREWDDFSKKLYDEEYTLGVIKLTYELLGGRSVDPD